MITPEMKITLAGTVINQFGKQVLVSQMPFATMEAIFEVDEEVQRKIDANRRAEIRDFILNSLDSGGFAFSPFIFSSRGNIEVTTEGGILSPGCKIYIIDGQHRSKAWSSAIGSLTSQLETAELTENLQEVQRLTKQIHRLRNYPVSVQIYLDLDTTSERQMFTDLNTKRKEPHSGVVMQFDQRDEYAELTRMIAKQIETEMEVEYKLSRLTKYSTALTSLTIMKRCLVALFEGNIRGNKVGRPNFGDLSEEEVKAIAIQFFNIFVKIFPRNSGNRKKYTCGYSGVQIALAYTVHQLVVYQKISYENAINHLLKLKHSCRWKHDDPVFQHIYDRQKKVITRHSDPRSIGRMSYYFRSLMEGKNLL